uniref:Uncharacterized protein n=1 Tax=Arundo donax TaxID=35708 RepID=A0A0A9AHA5_ARUDO
MSSNNCYCKPLKNVSFQKKLYNNATH